MELLWMYLLKKSHTYFKKIQMNLKNDTFQNEYQAQENNKILDLNDNVKSYLGQGYYD